MGNLFGKNKAALHPVLDRECDELLMVNKPSSSLRIKVRISTSQLKELMAKADFSKDNSELGQLILRECSEGMLIARVMTGEGSVAADFERSLSTINEHN